MAPITVVIKASNDKKYTIETDTDKTVLELKEQVEAVASIPPSRQRLIYSGRLLSKEEETIETYKVKDGNTIHLVQAKAPATSGDSSAASATPQIPMSAGTSASNPLEQLSGARYAGHNVPLPSSSMFGPDGGMTGSFGGPEDMTAMLEQPGVREAMDAAFSNPAFIDQMINSNPQLRNAPPYVRQMLQSPEFRRQMMDPNFIRQMNQMQQMMGGGPQRSAFPAPGPAQGAEGDANSATNNASAAGRGQPDMGAMMQMLQGMGGGRPPMMGNNGAQGAPPAQQMADPFQALRNNPAMMQQMSQMFGGGGFGDFGGMGAAAGPPEPADTRPPEERYAEQLRQLNDMGFFEFDRNVNALRRAGGSVQGAIEALLNGSV